MAHPSLIALGVGLGVLSHACGDASSAADAREACGRECTSVTEPSTTDAGGAADGPTNDAATPHAEDASTHAPLDPLFGEPGYGFVPGEPFALPAPEQGFVFIPVEGTVCQDGSPSGIAIERGTNELLLYLEGGGACFNDWTCLSSSVLFASRSFGASDLGRIPTKGMFADVADNPVRDWTKIFVGYCSGDVHSGAAIDGTGFNQQSQAGFANLRRMIARIVPSLPDTTRVLLAGSSAGGFGALLNWIHVQEAFGDVPVDALSDSGPMFSDAYLAPCLQQTWSDLWHWPETFASGCTDCFEDGAGAVGPYLDYLVTHFAQRRFGLMSYTEDTVIRLFYGAGEESCGTLIPSPTNYPGPRFTEGLLEVRTRLRDAANFSSFYVAGADHTFLASDSTVTASGQSVYAWLDAFLAGRAGHAGP